MLCFESSLPITCVVLKPLQRYALITHGFTFSINKGLTMTAKNIPSITIESPFGDPGLNIHCPICGQEVANNKGLNLCEHCLAAFYDGELIYCNDLGEEIFEEQTRPELFNSEDVDHNYMVATGSNFILSNLTGGMACGPVWGQLDLVFEAYPERLEHEDNEA